MHLFIVTCYRQGLGLSWVCWLLQSVTYTELHALLWAFSFLTILHAHHDPDVLGLAFATRLHVDALGKPIP